MLEKSVDGQIRRGDFDNATVAVAACLNITVLFMLMASTIDYSEIGAASSPLERLTCTAGNFHMSLGQLAPLQKLCMQARGPKFGAIHRWHPLRSAETLSVPRLNFRGCDTDDMPFSYTDSLSEFVDLTSHTVLPPNESSFDLSSAPEFNRITSASN